LITARGALYAAVHSRGAGQVVRARTFVGHNDEVVDLRWLNSEQFVVRALHRHPDKPSVRSRRLVQAVTNSPQFRVFNATTFDAELVAVRAARRAQGAGAETWRLAGPQRHRHCH
jgi:hypothetical protein